MGHKGKRVIKIDANVSCLGDLENGSVVNQKFSYGHGNERLLVGLQGIIYKKEKKEKKERRRIFLSAIRESSGLGTKRKRITRE